MKTQKKYVKKFLTVSLVIAICISSVISAHADYFSGTLLNKSQYNAITVWQHSSVSSYGYGNHYTNARNRWQSIDYSTLNFTVSSSDNEKYDKYYVGTTSVSGLYGEITPKKKNILGILVLAYPDDDWFHSIVKLYDNQMDLDNFSDDERLALATHELGHTIKLAHPSNYEDSVMNQPPLTSLSITAYDEQEFFAKW